VNETKVFWQSKMFWVNLLAAWALISQGVIGYEVFPIEHQATILAAVNLFLRFITGKPLVWK